MAMIDKNKWVEMFLTETLYDFLLKHHYVKKGESNSYASMGGITADDLKSYCEEYGFPGVNVPAHKIKTTPKGGEAETEWTLEHGVYTVWYSERNTSTWIFRTESKMEFEQYWIKENMESWVEKLNKLRSF